MKKIYIIGLGPGNIDSLTIGAIEKMKDGTKNYLRTKEHPTVDYLDRNGIVYEAFDDVYCKSERFEEVYETIVEKLIAYADEHGEVNYIVPGNPMVAEKTVKILMNKDFEDTEVKIVSGISFIEPMLELVKKDPIDGLQIVDGIGIRMSDLNINVDTIVTQVYSKHILSEVKLVLSEIYGDEYMVYFVKNAGMENESKDLVAIYELDRKLEANLLTSLYIPKMGNIREKAKFSFQDVLEIVDTLRGENGCNWDKEQTHESMRKAMIEEAYEVVNAIDLDDVDNLIEELGDVLLQVIFHSQIAQETGDFNIYEVLSSLGEKLIYRHPHVFSNKKLEKDTDMVYNWDVLKYEKRDLKTYSSILKDIKGLPSLLTSYKIQREAAKVGFDWENLEGPLDKISEELLEVKEAILTEEDIEGEIGDLLFSVVNLSRFLKIDPEVALNKTINKFITRFDYMEKEALKMEKDLKELSLEELDNLWNLAKTREKLEI